MRVLIYTKGPSEQSRDHLEHSPAFLLRPLFNSEMEDLCADLMDESEDFDEFDEFLESFDAPRYFDFTAVDNSRPDSPSWFCVRIGCNQNHEQVEAAALDRSFEHRVRAARAPALKCQKPPKPDRARPTPKYAHSASAKPAASANVGSAASTRVQKQFTSAKPAASASIGSAASTRVQKQFASAKPAASASVGSAASTRVQKQFASAKPAASASIGSAASTRVQKQFALNKADCHMLTSNKGKKPDYTNSKDLVLSEMSNSVGSICSIFKTSSIVSEIPALSQTTQSFENAMDANKENVPNDTCLEENCGKFNLLQKDCGNQHGVREKSKRMTIPKPFKLLTNERRIQRKTNLEKNINSEAKRETVSALRGRDGMKNNQIGKRVQKPQPQPTEATVARGKMVKLAENNLIKRKAQCQKSEIFKKELEEKSQEERVKGTSSKQSIGNQSLMAPKNAHSSLSNINKVIKANTSLPVKKSLTSQQASGSTSVGRYGVTGEAKLHRGKSVRLAPAHLITSHTQSLKKKQIDKMVQNPHPREARLDCGMSVRLAQAKLITSHPQSQKSNQIDRRVPKPQTSEARLGHGKIDRLARAKLVTSNPQCQMSESNQVELGETSHEELVNVASSKQSHKTQSQPVSRNAHSSSAHGNKVIANSHSNEDLVKVASSKHPHKTQRIIVPWNANCSSSHGNKVFTDNAHSQVEKPATGQGATGSAIVSRYGLNKIDNRMQKLQRIEAGLNLRNMAGDILMTENSECGKVEINKEKSHREVANVASSFTSLIEARNTSSSLTQVNKFMAGKETFSQWKKSATAQRLSTSAIRFSEGSKKNETGKNVQKSQHIESKLAHSKMVRFVGGKSIEADSHCHKTDNKDKLREKSDKEVVIVGSSGRLNSPSPMAIQNAQSCTPHGVEVITEKGACSQEKRLAATSKDPKLRKIHVPAGCLKKPEKAI